MSDGDLLDRVLLAALAEGALDPERVASFAAGLRERAQRILDERLKPVEQRAAAFERESRWKQEVIAGIEEEIRRLRAEMEALGREGDKAAQAHDRLLAHHRDVLRNVVEVLDALPRRSSAVSSGVDRLRDLAVALRKEIG